jgi:hypothetical protein
MTVTSASTLARPFAAASPPKPAPNITIRGRAPLTNRGNAADLALFRSARSQERVSAPTNAGRPLALTHDLAKHRASAANNSGSRHERDHAQNHPDDAGARPDLLSDEQNAAILRDTLFNFKSLIVISIRCEDGQFYAMPEN